MKLELEPEHEVTLREHLSRIGKIGRGKAKRRSSFHCAQAARMRWEKYRRDKIAHAKAVLDKSFPALSFLRVIEPQ